jgi:hypothetical protein
MHKNTMAMFLLGVATCLSGCNMKRFVVKVSYPMVEETIYSFFEETDLVFAQQAAPANLKLLEGMARGAKDIAKVQLAASQFMVMYAFGFLEDSVQDEDEQEERNRRASVFYLRGRDHAIRVLQDRTDFRSLMTENLDAFTKGLKEFKKKDVPALLWASFSWGLYINLNRHDIAAVADLSKVVAMAHRVIELDENYYYGSAHLFLMVFYGSYGTMIGGDPAKAKAEFERAWKISSGKYLVTKYLFAKTYCLQTLDRKLFEELLGEIITAPDDLFPEQALANKMMKQKAKRLLNMADDLF